MASTDSPTDASDSTSGLTDEERAELRERAERERQERDRKRELAVLDTSDSEGVYGWSEETLAPEDTTTIERQQEALKEAKQNVPRGKDRWGERVLLAWFNNLGYSNSLIQTDEHRSCQDCYATKQLYVWRGWGEICGWCSLNRFQNGGENPSEVEGWWERPREFYPEGCAPDDAPR